MIQVDDLKLRCDPSALAEGLHQVHGRKVAPDQAPRVCASSELPRAS